MMHNVRFSYKLDSFGCYISGSRFTSTHQCSHSTNENLQRLLALASGRADASGENSFSSVHMSLGINFLNYKCRSSKTDKPDRKFGAHNEYTDSFRFQLFDGDTILHTNPSENTPSNIRMKRDTHTPNEQFSLVYEAWYLRYNNMYWISWRDDFTILPAPNALTMPRICVCKTRN